MRIRVFLMRDVFWCGASVKWHFLPTLEMIALETWRDQNSEAYFVTDSVMMDRFRLGWVYYVGTLQSKPDCRARQFSQIDPQKLETTVNEFNVAVNGKPFDLVSLDGKATTGLSPNETDWVNPISKPPYYGVEMTSHLTLTSAVRRPILIREFSVERVFRFPVFMLQGNSRNVSIMGTRMPPLAWDPWPLDERLG